mgnify:CR=1 FL=1
MLAQTFYVLLIQIFNKTVGRAPRIPPIRTKSFTFRLLKDKGSEIIFNEGGLVFAISLRKRTNPRVSLPRRRELGPISIQSSILMSFINWLRSLNSLMALLSVLQLWRDKLSSFKYFSVVWDTFSEVPNSFSICLPSKMTHQSLLFSLKGYRMSRSLFKKLQF